MKPLEPRALSYGQERPAVLIAIFAFSTLLGVGLGYWLAPGDLPLWRTMAGGGALGFHAAMYPYVNRLLMA